jgi:hypothetical protein
VHCTKAEPSSRDSKRAQMRLDRIRMRPARKLGRHQLQFPELVLVLAGQVCRAIEFLGIQACDLQVRTAALAEGRPTGPGPLVEIDPLRTIERYEKALCDVLSSYQSSSFWTSPQSLSVQTWAQSSSRARLRSPPDLHRSVDTQASLRVWHRGWVSSPHHNPGRMRVPSRLLLPVMTQLLAPRLYPPTSIRRRSRIKGD